MKHKEEKTGEKWWEKKKALEEIIMHFPINIIGLYFSLINLFIYL